MYQLPDEIRMLYVIIFFNLLKLKQLKEIMFKFLEQTKTKDDIYNVIKKPQKFQISF